MDNASLTQVQGFSNKTFSEKFIVYVSDEAKNNVLLNLLKSTACGKNNC